VADGFLAVGIHRVVVREIRHYRNIVRVHFQQFVSQRNSSRKLGPGLVAFPGIVERVCETPAQYGTSGWGGHTELMGQWVTNHPSGSTIVVRYNPTDPKTAVLTATDMPDAGPRTPNNLRLLLISSVACVGLLTIARRL
jgi:hypothetical protein